MGIPFGRLANTWSHLRNEPGLGRNVTVVIIAVAIVLIASGYMMSKASFVPPFGRQTVHAEFQSVPGTNTTTTHKVTMAGVEVGTIVDTEVTDRGTAIVEMNIEAGHQIFDNARAVLRTINPLNEMYIEIAPGGPPGRPLPEDGTIPATHTERARQADEVLQHLDERSQRALTAVLAESDVALARAPQELPGGLRATDATTAQLRPVVEKLQTRRDKLSHLVTSLSRIAAATGGDQERIARLATSTEQALGAIASHDEELRATLDQLPGLNDGLRRTLTSTQDLTKELNPTLTSLHSASQALPPALERTTDTVENLGTTVDKARPLVGSARPVVANLRPLIDDVDHALDDTLPITATLDGTTQTLTSYLTDVQAFVFNTSSVFGVKDGQSGSIRAYLTQSAPGAGVLSGQNGAKPPRNQGGRNPAADMSRDHDTPQQSLLPNVLSGGGR